MVSPRTVLTALAAVAAVILGGCVPVTPSVQWQRSSFEGVDVISYVPEHPRGMVYFFHGSHGSASFVDRVETTDVVNRLVAKGYGFVSTSSTERTGDRRWNVFDPSLQTNPDLARLVRLQNHLVATTPLEANTPLVGIGMSNGARFVTLWGQVWKNASLPVKAIWASHGNTAPPFDAAGKLTIPTVFSTAENDFTVPPGQVIQDYATAHGAGTPSELYVSHERDLSAAQYMRIPGIDVAESKQIVSALIATGVWNAEGHRVEPNVQTAAARAAGVVLPASVRADVGEIQNETALLLGVHQFTAAYADRAIAFFGRYAPQACDTATPSSYSVGSYQTSLVDQTRSRTIPVLINYPAGYSGAAPVVIVSHGGSDGGPTRHLVALRYLGDALARAGYVGVFPNHSSTQPALDRPADVKFVLDQLSSRRLAVPGWSGSVDMGRVGEAGHSWGAYTALVIGGAKVTFGGAPQSFSDPRPKAFLALSPQGAGAFGFTSGSWATVTRPAYTMLGNLEQDSNETGRIQVPGWRLQPYEGMPTGNKYLAVLPGVDHAGMNYPTTPAAEAAHGFVIANGVAFFDTYVKGKDRSCAIGTLAKPAGTITAKK